MDKTVFNAAMLIGTALIGGGASLLSLPVGMIVTGCVVVALTFATLWVSR